MTSEVGRRLFQAFVSMFCWWKFVVRERHHARLLQGLYCAGVSCSFQLTFPAFPSETKRGEKKVLDI